MTNAFSSSESKVVRSGSAFSVTCGTVAQLQDNSGHNEIWSDLQTIFSYRQLWRMCAHGSAPVDTFQQHRQLGSCQRYFSIFRLRPDESASLQPLREQTQT